ncbi:YdeI/OmpD-associated family protein [Diaminobutyricimonas sp. TR449]|uniref:YdeI/OmpD-associated family protein n=1 Tax=Diaminobutyricimonas sp. TR449 TaxID=2708076 RepID=UPI00141D77B9|nr:YdeI/OmpD-associated family protein [Diaminobutyricimonas sp. TR449]
MGSRDEAERFHAETVDQWRDWLEANHDRVGGVWLVSWRSGTGKPSVDYEASVIEALVFGWVDGQAKVLDDERSMLWFTPRRPNSPWAATNKRRVQRLEAEGRMHPAGRRAIEAAKQNGMWTVLDGPENLIEPPELTAALDANLAARANWDAFPASVRKFALSSIALAKQAETRATRIATIVEKSARGERPQ